MINVFTWCRLSVDHCCISPVPKPHSVFSSPHQSPQPKSPQVFPLTPAPNPHAFPLMLSLNPQKPSLSPQPQSTRILIHQPSTKAYSTILSPQHRSTNRSPVQPFQIQNPQCYFTFQLTTLVQNPHQSMLLPQPLIPTILLHQPSRKTHNPIPITPPHPIYPHNPATLPQSQIPTIFLHHPKASQFMSTTQLQIPKYCFISQVPTTLNLGSSPQLNPQPEKPHNCT